ncbi:TetR/AcrR family transcriptional regulator [Rhodococcus maanshanensis]|uniref:TetR/AcrR family transcriptional regulator, lmrAB and yxaGH operons repressor n=1 Tax=Rhodococcus maanshanensis TaxID=183556 RepID=A0A1H7JFD9_9NOCA|nr:TetR/AcrR family transcriptional regulator [Rhodococcus maanshanensis]SEK73114.1 TetR/AcrR family transcriptional regulator, lmrAB and yxaGH operons repressor [Rhodococcus maanshanensis]
MKKGEETRLRMITVMATAVEEKGVAATGVTEVLERSGAPRGSLYFHFPGGKDELVAAALRQSADTLDALMAASLGGPPADVIARLLEALADRQVDSDFTKGCPIATVALETAGTDPLGGVCAEIYARWEAALADLIGDAALATEVFALIEGALLVGRVRRSREPIDAAVRAVRKLLETS